MNAQVVQLLTGEVELDQLTRALLNEGLTADQVRANPQYRELAAKVEQLRAAAHDGEDPFDGVVD